MDYKSLGLVNTKEMFTRAMKGGYAVPAFNFNNLEQLQAIIKAATEMRSPVIVQASKGARDYINISILPYLIKGAVEYSKALGGGKQVPIALNLDHGDKLETIVECIANGFSSVMFDGSHYDYEENVRLTREVVEYAAKYDVSVEGELGVLAGIEDDVSSEVSHYTNPEEVEDFVKRTGVDSLAISIGTSHGAQKFKLAPGETAPPLRFDILEGCEERIPGFPIVLHGASSIPARYIDTINKYGGKMENSSGISEDQVRKAASMSACKVNIDSDARLAFTAVIRDVFANSPGEFDPRKYLGPAREEACLFYKDKIKNVLGSNDKY